MGARKEQLGRFVNKADYRSSAHEAEESNWVDVSEGLEGAVGERYR